MLGTVVGSYRIIDRIAVGGMGTVYRAEHQLIGRIAAVKILHREMSANRDIVNRFFNEAKATTAIKHPGIVEIFDFGYMPSGDAFIVMEFLDGEPLSSRIRARGRMAEGEAAMLMRGVCSALAAAHAKRIVHRDLKPDNIFIVADPESPMGVRTKLLDFGIAKLTDVGLASSATKTGAVMGTPTYMSPEQCKGTGDVDHRADLYSIGCMLYELVVGRPPFIEAGAGELLGSHLFVEPEPPSRHGPISPELEGLIMQLLKKKPEQRVQTAFELAGQLVAIAAAQGWVTTTGIDGRLSMPMMPSPTPSSPLITPMHATPAPLPPMPMPMPTPLHEQATAYMPSSPSIPQQPKPTTLSGAASQSHEVPRRRNGLLLAVGAGLVAAAAGIGIVIATSGKASPRREPTSRPAPAVTQPAGETRPAEEPTPVEVAKPDEVPTPTEVATPADAAAPTEIATPTETKPVETTPVETKPVETKPVETKPVATKPVEPKPSTKPKVKPSTRPSTKPSTKPTKPKGGDLLETDI